MSDIINTGSSTIDLCHVYARIRELPLAPPGGSTTEIEPEAFTEVGQEVTVCAGRTRERTVYISESERLEVTVVTGTRSTNDQTYFMLKFNGT